MKAFLLLLLVGTLGCAGCSGHRDGGFKRAELREAAEKRTELRLADFTPFEWDRVYHYAAYYTPEQVGKDVRDPGLLLWVGVFGGVSEGDWLLVFVRGNRVQAAVRDMSLRLSFDLNAGESIARADAVFVPAAPNKGGWITLNKAHPVAPSPMPGGRASP